MSSRNKNAARRGYRAARLERVVAEILDCDLLPSLEDPALQGLSVLHLEIRNMACIHATLRPHDVGADEQAVRAALSRSEGLLRSQLAQRLCVKRMPELRLHYVAFPTGARTAQGGGHA